MPQKTWKPCLLGLLATVLLAPSSHGEELSDQPVPGSETFIKELFPTVPSDSVSWEIYEMETDGNRVSAITLEAIGFGGDGDSLTYTISNRDQEARFVAQTLKVTKQYATQLGSMADSVIDFDFDDLLEGGGECVGSIEQFIIACSFESFVTVLELSIFDEKREDYDLLRRTALSLPLTQLQNTFGSEG